MEKSVSIVDGKFLYEVFYDYPVSIGQDFDFGDDIANKEYLARFENEEIFNFYVTKSDKCECCNQWKELDSLGGIHAETANEAIAVFNDHTNV